MKRFVENEQIGVLDEGACQEAQTLFSAGELEESAVGNSFDAEALHPFLTFCPFLRPRAMIQTDRIRKTGSHNVDGGNVLLISAMELGRNIADVLLDLPDALSAAAFASEEFNVAGIALRVVGADEREQRALAGAVLAAKRPTVALVHHPVQVLQDRTVAVAYGDIVETENLRTSVIGYR